MDSCQTTCVGWRKQDDSSGWDAVVKTKNPKTQKPRKETNIESFNSRLSYSNQVIRENAERINRKRMAIQYQLDQEKLARTNWKRQQIQNQINWEKEEEIQDAYDQIERMEHKWNTGVENHIGRVEQDRDMIEWICKLKTTKDAQFWFDFMVDYNPRLLVEIEFYSDKGWYTECSHCNWSIQKGMDEDYCRCAKTITF